MFFEYRGAKLNYISSGEGGVPLLILHGWGCSIATVDAVTREFAKDRRVIAVDFPGHGESPAPETPWTVGDYKEITRALLDNLNIQRADIIAHSFGGRVALKLAAENPEYVNRLLLTGCAGIPPKTDAKLSARTKKYKRLRALCDNSVIRAVFGKRVDAWKENLVQKYGSADYKVLSPVMRATFNNVIKEDLTWCLDKISAPTYLVWGTEDTATPLWMGELMAERIKDARLVRFSGATHFAFIEQLPRFITIARAFLN